MMIPLRAGDEALVISWDLEEIAATLGNLNVEMERVWASLLTVVRDSWPEMPIEVWTTVEEVELIPEVDADPEPQPISPYRLKFAVFFGGGDRMSKTVAAMASFVLSGISRAMPLEPEASWGTIAPDWKPLWAVDDANVLRLFAPERTLDRSLYLLGSYAGRPMWFAASEEAWPLQKAQEAIGISLADADVTWAFDL
ncbi:MAG: hypothetical protein KDA24_26645 [Deltaproteobacteria bacterium]|nr:hypothetical protein [Deltaproteobacteria bacterium]